MTACDRWQHGPGFASGRVDPELRAHLAACPECRATSAKWETLAREIPRSVALEIEAFPVRDAEVLAAVHDRIDGGHRAIGALPRWVGAMIAVAAATVLILVFTPGEDPSPPMADAPRLAASATVSGAGGAAAREVALTAGQALEAPRGGSASLRVAGHRVSLAGGAAVRLAGLAPGGVELELDRGEALFEVDFGEERGSFSVAAGGIVVSVRGTRFTVTRSPTLVTVAVSEGRVAVLRRDEQTLELVAGERLEIGAAAAGHAEPSEPAVPPSVVEPARPGEGGKTGSAATREQLSRQEPEVAPDLERLRGLMIEGRLAEAEAGLTALVERRPDDADAWWNLGECRRRAGRHAAAVDAYRRVIATGSATEAALARLKAGIISQERLGRHGDAVELFRDYLDAGGGQAALRAEVLVRHARSLVALGRGAEARPILEEVVERHGANPVAAEARELLEKTN